MGQQVYRGDLKWTPDLRVVGLDVGGRRRKIVRIDQFDSPIEVLDQRWACLAGAHAGEFMGEVIHSFLHGFFDFEGGGVRVHDDLKVGC